MRAALVILGLVALAACAPPPQTVMLDDNAGLMRFLEPTNGAAYAQSDARYYTANANGFANGGNIPMGLAVHHP